MTDKSPRQKLSRKSVQSLKQKRAAKKGKSQSESTAAASRKPRRG